MTDDERIDAMVVAINLYCQAIQHDEHTRTRSSYVAAGVAARKLERTLHQVLGARPPGPGQRHRIIIANRETR